MWWAVGVLPSAAISLLLLCWTGDVGAYTGASTPWLEQRVSTFLSNREATLSAQLPMPQATISDYLKRISSGQADNADASPVRIHIEYQLGESITGLQRAFLTEKLLPATVAELQRHLKVRSPVAGPLFLARECVRSAVLADGSRHCVEASPQEYCGSPTLSILHNLKDFFGGYTLCNQDRTTCTDYLGGPGVEGTDFVLYVIAKDVECTKSSLAFAAPCELDLFNSRPLAGFINFCPTSLSPDPGQFTNQLGTAVHEALHALGFTSPLFSLYSDDSGTPWGLTNMLKEEDGHFFVATPTVAAQVRSHFQCSALLGAKLEDEGASGTVGSHWDSRWFQGEIMDGSTDGSSSQNVFSNITLALMEDTGWYLGNWEAAMPLEFGYHKGCQFLASCAAELTEGGLPPWDSYWCDLQVHNASVQLCTWDHKGVGVCDVDGLMNGCASPKPMSQRVCFQPEHGSPDFLWGTTQGPNVRCLHESGPILRSVQGQVLQKSDAEQAADCYAMQCNAEGRLLVSVAGSWAPCPSGEMLSLDSHGYLQGSLGPCPDNAQMCAELACPAHCSGHGRCVDGQCRCHVGWAGPTCDRFICSSGTNSLSCPPQSICEASSGICVWGLPVPSEMESDVSTDPPVIDWLTPVPTLPPILDMTPYITSQSTPLVSSLSGAANSTWTATPGPTEAYGLPFPMATTAPAIDLTWENTTDEHVPPAVNNSNGLIGTAPQGEPYDEVPPALPGFVGVSFAVKNRIPGPLSQQQLHGLESVLAYLLGIGAAAVTVTEGDVPKAEGSAFATTIHHLEAAVDSQWDQPDTDTVLTRLEEIDINANKAIFQACCSLDLVVGSLESIAFSAPPPLGAIPSDSDDGPIASVNTGSSFSDADRIIVIAGFCLTIVLLIALLCTCLVLQLQALRSENKPLPAGKVTAVPPRHQEKTNTTSPQHANGPYVSAGVCPKGNDTGRDDSVDTVPLRPSKSTEQAAAVVLVAKQAAGRRTKPLLSEEADGIAGGHGQGTRASRRGAGATRGLREASRDPGVAEAARGAPAPPPATAAPAAKGVGGVRRPGGAARELRERLERLTEQSHLQLPPRGPRRLSGLPHLHDSGASLEAEEEQFLRRLAPSTSATPAAVELSQSSALHSESARSGKRQVHTSRDPQLKSLRERYTEHSEDGQMD